MTANSDGANISSRFEDITSFFHEQGESQVFLKRLLLTLLKQEATSLIALTRMTLDLDRKV